MQRPRSVYRYLLRLFGLPVKTSVVTYTKARWLCTMTEVNYLIVTPARDEESFIEKTIQSVVLQTILPQEWIIVDDGSTDKTRNIVLHYAREHGWIRLFTLPDRGKRQLGAAVVNAFNYGFRKARIIDYEFLCKLDADIVLPLNYFEFLFERFQENPRLGIASGCTYIQSGKKLVWERTYEKHSRGMMKVYCRRCFENINGLVSELGWDVIDDYKAQMNGWHTRNFKNLKVLHHRPMGSSIKGILTGKIRGGHIQYLLNYHPLFAFFSGVYRMFERPYILAGLAMWYGYLSSFFTEKERVVNGSI